MNYVKVKLACFVLFVYSLVGCATAKDAWNAHKAELRAEIIAALQKEDLEAKAVDKLISILDDKLGIAEVDSGSTASITT